MKEYGITVPCDRMEKAQMMEQHSLVINAVT